MGVSSGDPSRIGELLDPFQQITAKLPGTFGMVQQFSIFSSDRGGGRNVDVEITGPELEQLIALGGEVLGGVMGMMPTAQAMPIPSLDLGNPEVQVRTHRRRAAELGITNRSLGFAVSALVDGVKASDYQFEGKEIDIVIEAEIAGAQHTHMIEQLPIATPDGRLVTLGSVADISVVNGPTTINHRERQRTITIQVNPPESIALEEAMELIDGQILAPMREQGRLGGLYQAALTGSASKLRETRQALAGNFILALIITYLLMAALFESFLYPFVIMFSVPLAALGGFLGLAIVQWTFGQRLDVLTMLGFPVAEPHAGRGDGPEARHPRVGARARPADLHERHDVGLRDDAADPVPRGRLRALPRPRKRRGRRPDRLDDLHALPGPGAVQPRPRCPCRAGRAAEGDGAHPARGRGEVGPRAGSALESIINFHF